MMPARAACMVLVWGAATPVAGAAPRAKQQRSAPSAAAPAPGPGSLDPFRAPAPKAVELNAAGKVPYRQGKWEEARAQYRAAEAADPEFLAPKLNVACSFVREERFAEATTEVVALVQRAYVPWAREVLEAADLGALKVRPEMKQIQDAMASAAARWGEGLDTSLIFVARQRPALHVPDGPGVFVLNPHQEAWAYTLRTRRYRQLTAEDGHVVAIAPSMDKSSVVYVTAEKLIRGGKPDELALRGVSVRELTLATMALGPRIPVAGDVRRLAIYNIEITKPHVRPLGADVVAPLLTLEVTTDKGGPSRLRIADGVLIPANPRLRLPQPVVTLTGRGVTSGAYSSRPGQFFAHDVVTAAGVPSVSGRDLGGVWQLVVPDGAGCNGLPIP
jgi:hypothetical protein